MPNFEVLDAPLTTVTLVQCLNMDYIWAINSGEIFNFFSKSNDEEAPDCASCWGPFSQLLSTVESWQWITTFVEPMPLWEDFSEIVVWPNGGWVRPSLSFLISGVSSPSRAPLSSGLLSVSVTHMRDKATRSERRSRYGGMKHEGYSSYCALR